MFKNLKISDKLFDLLKAALSVILAGIVGTWVSYHFKKQETKETIILNTHKEAESLYNEIIDIFGKRHYYALRLMFALKDVEYFPEDVNKKYDEYDKTVIFWNENRYRILSSTERHFGEDTVKEIYKLLPKFNEIHQFMRKCKNKIKENEPLDQEELSKYINLIYELDDDISNFGDFIQNKLDKITPKSAFNPLISRSRCC
jgi:hypothetical protein